MSPEPAERSSGVGADLEALMAAAPEDLSGQLAAMHKSFQESQAEAVELLGKARERIEDLFIDRQRIINSARQQAALYRQKTNEQAEAAARESQQLQERVQELTELTKSQANQILSLQEQVSSITADSMVKQRLMEQSCERISVIMEPCQLAKLVFGSLSVTALSAQAARAGWLTKQGAMRKNWKKRYHVLVHNFLLYYRGNSDSEPLGALYLGVKPTVEHLPHTNQSRPNSVRITSNDRTYLFCCDSRDDAELWVGSLDSSSCWYLSHPGSVVASSVP